MKFESNFYIRRFSEHLHKNAFIEKPHGHNFYLVLLVTKGSGNHIIDFTEYEIVPGALFIISPGQIHQWKVSEDIDGYILFFTKPFFLHDFNTDRLANFPFFNSTFSSPYILLNSKEIKEVESKYVSICKEYKYRALNYQDMIRIYLNSIFIFLSRIYPKKSEISHKKYGYDLLQLYKFEALVDKYYKLHRPISCYSKKMNITDRQLSYLCKKTINKKPSEIITERIILEAKRLIIHSNLSIGSIAEELNYKEPSYFIRLFKKITLQTPEQFRNEQYTRYIPEQYKYLI